MKKNFLKKPFSDQNTDLILKHLLNLKDAGLSARSRARHLVTLRGFYRFLINEKLFKHDPVKFIDLPKSGLKLPDVLSVEDVENLLSIPDSNSPKGVRDSAMIELLYAAGLRVSELLNLRLMAVNMDACYVRVIGKGAKEKIDHYMKFARPFF